MRARAPTLTAPTAPTQAAFRLFARLRRRAKHLQDQCARILANIMRIPRELYGLNRKVNIMHICMSVSCLLMHA